jgi:DNA-directed RNA polymerase specialized sigma24 family protein
MDSDPYQQMRTVVAAPRLARAIAIGSRFCARAAAMLERLGLAGVTPSAAVDRQLLEARALGEARELDEAGLLLCLRCRVSHAAEQKILALVRHFGHRHQLDPIDLAATVLDDEGDPLPWPAVGTCGAAHRPFSLEVIDSYRPELAGLGHWTRLRVQSHPPLVRLLREHGLLLQRDWSLLAHASPGRMARAWEQHGSAALSPSKVATLHQCFRDHYRQARGDRRTAAAAWEPGALFLSAIEPPTAAPLTLGRLQAMATALRRDRLAALPMAGPEGLEAVAAAAPAEDPSPGRVAEVEAALRRALARQLPAMLAADGPEVALRACLWRHYAKGHSQRRIGEACGCCQPKVNRRLQCAAHAAAIATTALGFLLGREGFEAVGRSLAATESQAAALRDYLLACPAAGDRPRLAHWLEPLLEPPVAVAPPHDLLCNPHA